VPLSTPDPITHCGGCRDLSWLPDHSIHMVFLSPPYLGQRAYPIEPDIWPAATYDALTGAIQFSSFEDCAHEWGAEMPAHKPNQVAQSNTRNADAAAAGQTAGCGNYCQLCEAWRGTLGNEPTIFRYVADLVWLMREVRRVLRPDGSLWVNLGDIYMGSWGNYGARKGKQRPRLQKRYDRPGWDDYR